MDTVRPCRWQLTAVRLFAFAAALVVAVTAPPTAAAQDVSRAQLRALAERADDDPVALAELKEVDSVEGHPVDLARALSGDADDVDERLETLTETGAPASVDPDTTRREARDILSDGRFHESETPRPFRGLLEWIGDRLAVLDRPLDWLIGRLPGGRNTFSLALAALVAAAAAVVASRLVRRRSARTLEELERRRSRSRLRPDDLERAADEAERRGELERALRLRFRAGLLRLDRARAISYRDSLTSGEIARQLGSEDFTRLAATFDEVVYGGRQPDQGDVKASRAAWARVLQEVAVQ
jgi:hypothetical protein